MIIKGVSKESGQSEVLVKLNIDEVEYIKGAVNIYLQRGFGDKDDIQQTKLGESLADGLLECKNQLKPN